MCPRTQYGPLRHVCDRDSDELLHLRWQRTVREHELAEFVERGVRIGRKLAALLSDSSFEGGV